MNSIKSSFILLSLLFFLSSIALGQQKLASMNPDGNGQRLVLDMQAGHAKWSGDMSKIVFSSGESTTGRSEIFIYDIATDNVTQLTSYGHYYGQSRPFFAYPDKIWWNWHGPVAGNSEIYSMNLDGSDKTALTDFLSESRQSAGCKIAGDKVFYSKQNRSWSPTKEIYSANLNFSGQTRLTFNNNDDQFYDVTPDGTMILFSRYEASNGYGPPANVYLLRPGIGETKLTHVSGGQRCGSAYFSPDGSKIVYAVYDGSTHDLWVMDIDGSNKINITNTPEYDEYPSDWKNGRILYTTNGPIEEINIAEEWCLDIDPIIGCANAFAACAPVIGSIPETMSLRDGFCLVKSHFSENRPILGKIRFLHTAIDFIHYVITIGGQEPTSAAVIAATSCALAFLEEIIIDCVDNGQSELQCWKSLFIPSGIPGTEQFYGIYAACPIDITIYDVEGNTVETPLENNLFCGTSDLHLFKRKSTDSKTLIAISNPDIAFQIKITGDNTAIFPDSTFTLYLGSYNESTSSDAVFNNIPIGAGQEYTIQINAGSMDPVLVGDINGDGIEDQIYPTGTIAGTVSYDQTGVMAVPVVLLDANGSSVNETNTDEYGQYSFNEVGNGEYHVSIDIPLGFQPLSDTDVPVEITGNDIEINFELGDATTGKLRSFWWWQDQLEQIRDGDTPFSGLTADSIDHYGTLIYEHFIDRTDGYGIEINGLTYLESSDGPLNFDYISTFFVDDKSTDTYTKIVKNLLTVMINVASARMSQNAVISTDGATVSQAITHYSSVLESGVYTWQDWYYPMKIHSGYIIPSGIIPLGTPNVMYKEEGFNSFDNLPGEFSLSRNYPNPFNPSTRISFTLPEKSEVRVDVFNIMGQKVATLADGSFEAGHHTVTWDASQNASGVYFYKLTTGEFAKARKMILLK